MSSVVVSRAVHCVAVAKVLSEFAASSLGDVSVVVLVTSLGLSVVATFSSDGAPVPEVVVPPGSPSVVPPFVYAVHTYTRR